MKLILAQGNPGPDYAATRHNVGFMALDYYAAKHSLVLQSKTKWNADIAEQGSGSDKVLFVKPTTFYNETGQAARALVDFYHLAPSDILVLHDELALPFGIIRTRERGSDAGNNGIKSLNAHLGETYTRVRIGIGNDLSARIPAMDFVLGNFLPEEKARLEELVFPKAAELIDDFIAGTLEKTSHTLHAE